jgi:hypothetical protein
MWLFARGWSAVQVAEALERDSPYDRRLAGSLPPERTHGLCQYQHVKWVFREFREK